MSTPNDTTPLTLKRCTKCGFTCDYAVASQFFSRNKQSKDKLQFSCKRCNATYYAEHLAEKRAYYAENQEKICAYSRAYNAAHPEEKRDYMIKYRTEHQQELRAYRITYDDAHREQAAARYAAYYATHREKKAIYRAANYAAHREERLAYSAAYRSKHAERYAAYRTSSHGKELNRIHQRNRRALKRAKGDRVTKAEYAAVLKAHTNKKGEIVCAWCGNPIESNWHFDHWIPLDKGGRHEAGNLRVMHGHTEQKCNLHKSNILPFDFGKLI